MNSDEFPILKITNIEWSKKSTSLENMPKELELGWGDKNWNYNNKYTKHIYLSL